MMERINLKEIFNTFSNTSGLYGESWGLVLHRAAGRALVRLPVDPKFVSPPLVQPCYCVAGLGGGEGGEAVPAGGRVVPPLHHVALEAEARLERDWLPLEGHAVCLKVKVTNGGERREVGLGEDWKKK